MQSARPAHYLAVAAVLLCSACAGGETGGADGAQTPSGAAAGTSATSSPTPSDLPPSPPGEPTGGETGDVTRSFATQFVAPAPPPAPSPAVPGVVYGDPFSVASAFVTARNTYAWTDTAHYAAALTAPALTTPAFAQRSAPDEQALAALTTAQESSAVQVGTPTVEDEAPADATTAYVEVPFTATVTYAGAGSGVPSQESWSLRLVLLDGQWRVDGVLDD